MTTKTGDNDNLTHLEEHQRLVDEVEQWLADFDSGLDRLTGHLETARVEMERAAQGMTPKALGPDSPVPLARAVCLPVFGGVLAEAEKYDQPSPAVTVDKMRAAINRGLLNTTALDAKNKYITPRQAEERIASVQASAAAAAKAEAVAKPNLAVRIRPTTAAEREREARLMSQQELALARVTKAEEAMKKTQKKAGE